MINKIGQVKDSIIRQIDGEKNFCFLAPAAINCDGDPMAYHPLNIGKDYLANAGEPGNWYGIACDKDGKPYVQQTNDPAPGYYVSTTALVIPKFPESSPSRYIDSSKIPFIVLPMEQNFFGAKLGDLAVVIDPRSGKHCGAIFADVGTVGEIGEISIFLADQLGINSDPKNGGSDQDFIYVVFPETSPHTLQDAVQIKAVANRLFSDWGGFGTIASIYPVLVSSVTQPVDMASIAPKIMQNNLISVATKHPLLVTFTADSYIKQSPAAAASLPDSEKVFIKAGSSYDATDRLSDVGKHYQIKFAEYDFPVFIYKDHVGLSDSKETDDVIVPTNKKTIQDQLIQIGLLDPPSDGKWGSQSESAKRAWLRVCGDISDFTPDSLAKLTTHPSIKDLAYTPKDPNDKENILVTKAIAKMVDLGFHVAVSMGSDALAYNLFYIAGTNPDGSLNDDKIDQWNDLRCVVSISSTGVVAKHGVWTATVDAGNYWRGNRRMNPDGALQVDKNKQFLSLSSLGRHGSKQYPALVQVGELTGTRDRTGDGRTTDDTEDSGNFGSNDHHGYDQDNVGIMSAGCCVGKYIKGHEDFMEIIETDRRYRCNNAYSWHRTILDGKIL
jgi:Fungal chitosanase of glycosyl hydrolase group 75